MSAGNHVRLTNPAVPVFATKPQGIEWGTPLDLTHAVHQAVDVDALGRRGELRVHDQYFRTFSLRRLEATFERRLITADESGVQSGSQIGLCLFLKGNVEAVCGNERVAAIKSGFQNIKFDPNADCLHLCHNDSAIDVVHIAFNHQRFFECLPDDESWADQLRTRIVKRERIMAGTSAPIRKEQFAALNTILDCPLTGKSRELMIESAVIQVLVLQLHDLFGRAQQTTSTLTRMEYNHVRQLKEILDKSFLQELTLAQLAKEVGVNQSKLMRSFRIAYGQTIFDYVTTLRMQHANRLLLEGESVTRVAAEIGYRNMQHFSTAFRKRYGYSPSFLSRARA